MYAVDVGGGVGALFFLDTRCGLGLLSVSLGPRKNGPFNLATSAVLARKKGLIGGGRRPWAPTGFRGTPGACPFAPRARGARMGNVPSKVCGL